jgi:4-diphosphocytidyl-2-C-methyl-D-erythritol kinase
MPSARAPAKLNLTLEILGRRADGYHTLRSVMVPIGLYDRLEFAPAQTASFTCTPATLAKDNLVLRALDRAGVSAPLRVELEKHIPAGGGLGGGSSDAAATLTLAANGALGPLPSIDWLAAATALGSDVPFFLCGTGALVEGTGERVTALGKLPRWWCLLARPPVAVNTAEAYRLFDAARPAAHVTRPRANSVSLAAVDALQRRDFDALHALLANDFHDVILAAYPAIAHAHGALRDAGAPKVLLSGSGSCIFALFESEFAARSVAERCTRETGELFVVPLVSDERWR